MQRPNQHLIDKATTLLRDYENRLKQTQNAGDLEEHVLDLCKDGDEISPYVKYLETISFLKVIAKPKVQKVLLEEMHERELDGFIEILGGMIHFFRSMEAKQFETTLLIVDLNGYPHHYEERSIVDIINNTERKMKSLDAAKKISVCKN